MTDFPLVRGRVLRVTRLDGCGVPVLSPESQVVTNGFISVVLTPNNVTIDAISLTNANGDEIVSVPSTSRFSNYTVTATFGKVMPELFSMMTGMPVIYDAAGAEAIGISINSQVDVDLTGFALEVWSTVPQIACVEGGDPSYGYSLLPFLKGGVLSGVTFENGAISFGIENATTRDGNGWEEGPYNVERDESELPGPLNTPLDPNDHKRLQLVTVAPPEVTDGAVALGVVATGATAGTPGSFTPSNSYGPEDLAGMTGLTASPSTAWTTGQHVLTRDGDAVHWDGDSWEAGAA